MTLLLHLNVAIIRSNTRTKTNLYGYCFLNDVFSIFLFSGVIHINCEDAQDILAAADMLELTAVVDLCCKFLISELHPSNCIG